MPPAVAAPTFATPRVDVERRRDGTILLRQEQPLGDCADNIGSVLRTRSDRHPQRILAAHRGPNGGWESLTYGEARIRADALARAFLDLGLSADRPIMALSGNSIEHLLVTLAAHTAGIPMMPISVAYSLQSRDHARVRAIADLTRPGLVFADDAIGFAPALDALAPGIAHVLVSRGERRDALQLFDLTATSAASGMDGSVSKVGAHTVAKVLFTSGSTGAPKGVINTHRMLCSNQAMLAKVWPFLAHEPPVMVDWLPWSHTFGGNHNLNLALFNGGTLYIDDGKPVPPRFARTLSALREVPPTVYFNVPAGYALLVAELESDREFAETFFSRLRFMMYAAATLPEAIWQRLRRVADEVADHPIPLTSSWGATETAPGATTAHFSAAACGCIGVPLPGVTVKLVPDGEKFEIRVAGPNVTPGYFSDAVQTNSAFDREGFYRTGDAARLIDEHDADQGLMFDGRLAEDFKLATGTFVTVGQLRANLISRARVLSDAVICGHNREYVGALAWVNQTEARVALDSSEDLTLDDPRLTAHLASVLGEINQGAGSASRIERLLLLDELPELDAGEITDKGYVNQRRVLERRAALVGRLYAEPCHPEVITPASSPSK